MISRRQILFLPAALYVGSAAVGQARARAGDYPVLDDKQLGHLRFIANVARRRHNDWSGMDSEEPGQGGFDAYRYQLAMMAYTTHLANYHYTPAWRELHQATSERLIEKMLRFDVWSFWEMVSRGAKQFDPSLAALSEGWRDPVIRQNIMYSGHLFHMVTTYAMLYDSGKYEQPGALTFEYNPVGRGMGRETFAYDSLKLAEVLQQQFDANGYEGIECEPNAIFVECNQHPILGFRLLDHRHGTNYFANVSSRYLRAFEEQQFFDADNGSSMFFKMIKQNRKIPAEMPWNDGWAGLFMHGWAPEKVRQVYPLLKRKYVVQQADGSAVIPFQKPSRFWSWDNGFFAALAAEVGDHETAEGILAYADQHWAPTWQDSGLYYPRNDAFEVTPGQGNGTPQRFTSPRVNTLTGNALVGLARINVANGLLSMFRNPWTAQHFRQPHIADVSGPNVQVSRAIYDAGEGALIVQLRQASNGPKVERASLSVRNLSRGATHRVLLNGDLVGQVRDGSASANVSGVVMRMESDVLALEVPMRAATDLVIRRAA